MATHPRPAFDILTKAAHTAGLEADNATLIRDGANVLYELEGTVARIGRPGTETTASREVAISRWLDRNHIPVVTALDAVPQPTMADGRPVTWWTPLPPHRVATPAELGTVLRTIHDLPIPTDVELPVLDPFADLDARLTKSAALPDADHAWLEHKISGLREQYARLPRDTPPHVVHGDAWQGNIAVPKHGKPIILDLEHVSIGPPQWDLISLAVDHTDFARITETDYHSFVTAYGWDVTTWPGYRTLADLQELRWLAFILTKAATNPAAATEAAHRIACLRGQHPRPWTWHAF